MSLFVGAIALLALLALIGRFFVRSTPALLRCAFCDYEIAEGTEQVVTDHGGRKLWCGECDMSGLDPDEEDEEDAEVWGDAV